MYTASMGQSSDDEDVSTHLACFPVSDLALQLLVLIQANVSIEAYTAPQPQQPYPHRKTTPNP